MNITQVMDYIQHYGYISLFFIFMIGVIAAPIPAEVLLIFVGYMILQGKMNGLLLITMASLGCIAGMSVNYWLGNRLGKNLIRKYGEKIHLSPEQFDRVEKWFERHEGLIIVIGYFVPGVRHLSPIVAGIVKFSLKKYFVFSIIGALVWISSFISIGYFLGERWKTVVRSLQDSFDIWMIVGMVVVVLVLLMKDRIRIKNSI